MVQKRKNKPFNNQDFEQNFMENHKMEKIEWLWQDRIPRGKITFLVGNPGVGKGFLWMDIAARLTSGRDWPDSKNEWDPCIVAFMQSEDGVSDTIMPRAVAAGMDLSRFLMLTGTVTQDNLDGTTSMIPFNLQDCKFALEKIALEHPDLRMLVLDPITEYLSGTDENKNAEVREALAWLSAWADRTKIAVLAVSHLNKNWKAGAEYRIIGSIAFTAVARMVWHCVADEEIEGRVMMLAGKRNSAKHAGGLGFQIQSAMAANPGGEDVPTANVAWEATALSGDATRHFSTQMSPSARARNAAGSRCVDLLKEWLNDGPVLSTVLKERFKEEKISESTVKRVKKKMKIEAFRPGEIGGPWWWRLPNVEG
jgi:hypothetical protein